MEKCDYAVDQNCTTTCQHRSVIGCGNGVLDAGEQCDDGGVRNSDGCSDRCLLEYTSSAQYCGDRIVQGSEGEECDLGITGNGVPGSSCSADCHLVQVPSQDQVCGNGIVERGEQCDAGSSVNGNYFGASCLQNCLLPYCGDGVVSPNEMCDYNDKTNPNRSACTHTCETALAAAPGTNPLVGSLVPGSTVPGQPGAVVGPDGQIIRNIPTPARASTGPGLIIFLVSGAAAGIGVVRRRYLK